PRVPIGVMTGNLAVQCSPLVHSALTRACHSGRAAGMEAIAFAFRYLLDSHDYILVGGSDSFCSRERLKILDNANRALTSETADRSEEHTSELQSRENLVCRLLL